MTNIATEHPKNKWRFIAGKIIYFHGPFSMAMLNNQRVYMKFETTNLLFIRDPSFSNAKKRFAGLKTWRCLNCCFGRAVPFAVFLHQDLRSGGAGATADIDSFMFLKNNEKKAPTKQFDEFLNFMICWVLNF